MDALQVVAEPRRREILRLVWDRELSAGEISSRFDVSFPAISQHLRVLRGAGLVSVRHAGRNRYYRAEQERIGPLREALRQMWEEAVDRLAELAEAEDGR